MRAITRFVLTATCGAIFAFGALATAPAAYAGGNLPAGPCKTSVSPSDDDPITLTVWQDVEFAYWALRAIGTL
jgi:hypothetical protein